jgi:ABC-type branched-subunit amino acid transport system ATPase component
VLWGLAYRISNVTNGDNGVSGLTRPTPLGIPLDGAASFYWFALIVFTAAFFMMAIFMSSSFGSSLSVRENLMVAQQRESATSNPWGLDRVYDMFPRLRERHGQFAGTLSGGEQQMLAIGRALMGNPRVLLLDEPSEGLVPLIVAEVGRAIRRLKEEGQSIILVEQNRQLALDVADQAVILNTGRCVFAGSATDVLNNEELIAQNLGVVHAPEVRTP